MTTIKGPAIFLAQFLGDQPPFNSLASIVAACLLLDMTYGARRQYSVAAALAAVDNCHGKDLMGRTVVVNEARPMASRADAGGRPPRY